MFGMSAAANVAVSHLVLKRSMALCMPSNCWSVSRFSFPNLGSTCKPGEFRLLSNVLSENLNTAPMNYRTKV